MRELTEGVWEVRSPLVTVLMAVGVGFLVLNCMGCMGILEVIGALIARSPFLAAFAVLSVLQEQWLFKAHCAQPLSIKLKLL